ncbi:MAG: hypothetical protein JWM80_2040, partial [Cyanobacteria bacterium RYN_339]|nr:hypothetical protein [Cyanobacteria bacterium RYN_339]
MALTAMPRWGTNVPVGGASSSAAVTQRIPGVIDPVAPWALPDTYQRLVPPMSPAPQPPYYPQVPPPPVMAPVPPPPPAMPPLPPPPPLAPPAVLPP